jgi:hypothetical protein
MNCTLHADFLNRQSKQVIDFLMAPTTIKTKKRLEKAFDELSMKAWLSVKIYLSPQNCGTTTIAKSMR